MENMKLNNNLECPMLGLGTFMLSPEDAYTSTLEALKMGYSLIDTANAYVNERAVGRAIKDSGIDRKNIFLSTKIWASCSCAKFLSQLLIIFDTNFRKIFSEFNTRNGGIFALRFFDI